MNTQNTVEAAPDDSKSTNVGPRFTKRDIEIVRLVERGYSNAEIGEMLSINRQSVANKLNKIYKMLGVGSRVDLIIYIQRNGEINEE